MLPQNTSSVVTNEYNDTYKQTFTAEVKGNRLWMKFRFEQIARNYPHRWFAGWEVDGKMNVVLAKYDRLNGRAIDGDGDWIKMMIDDEWGEIIEIRYDMKEGTAE